MYLDSYIKTECTGCEACTQVCTQEAIFMFEDQEGFRYPKINRHKCINCGICREICPQENALEKHSHKYVFGGYHLNSDIRFESTSGGGISNCGIVL